MHFLRPHDAPPPVVPPTAAIEPSLAAELGASAGPDPAHASNPGPASGHPELMRLMRAL